MLLFFLIPSFQASASQSAGLLGKEEPISLELHAVLPADAFRLVAETLSMDLIVVSPIDSDPITISLKNARLGEAFGYLLRGCGLSHRVMGRTLVIGTEQAVAAAAADDETRGYRLAYADLKSTAALIDAVVAPIGGTLADERTRTLYVKGTLEQHRRTAKLLEGADLPGEQITLEARLIEVNNSAKDEVEAMITAIYRGWLYSQTALGGLLSYSYSNTDRGTGVEQAAGTTAAGSAMKTLDAGLRAMESEHKGKVLASPSITAIDGSKAVIKLTRNYLYQSGVDDKGNARLSEQETGPMLEITPLIGRDGFITLKLKISSGEIISFHKSGQSVAPETSRREVDTSVRVRDGELFVIGGLYSEIESKSVTRTPVLGYIPLLGELFTARGSVHSKSELAFIVIPHIIGTAPQAVDEAHGRPPTGGAL